MLVWITFREGTRSPETGFEPSIAHQVFGPFLELHLISWPLPSHTNVEQVNEAGFIAREATEEFRNWDARFLTGFV